MKKILLSYIGLLLISMLMVFSYSNATEINYNGNYLKLDNTSIYLPKFSKELLKGAITQYEKLSKLKAGDYHIQSVIDVKINDELTILDLSILSGREYDLIIQSNKKQWVLNKNEVTKLKDSLNNKRITVVSVGIGLVGLVVGFIGSALMLPVKMVI